MTLYLDFSNTQTIKHQPLITNIVNMSYRTSIELLFANQVSYNKAVNQLSQYCRRQGSGTTFTTDSSKNEVYITTIRAYQLVANDYEPIDLRSSFEKINSVIDL